MQVCHFFATSGCRHSGAGCTSGSHDPSLVFPYLQSIVCPICVQHGQCTAKGCSKQHAPQVINRYNQELAARANHGRNPHTRNAPPPAPFRNNPAPVRLPSPMSLVHVPQPVSAPNVNALVTRMQGLGFVSQPGKAKTTEQVTVKQKRRKTNVVVVLDLSGSMSGKNLTNAKRELNKLWNLLEKGDSLTIITFSNTVSVAMTRRFKYQPKPGQAKQAWQFDETDLQAVVAGLRADGGTALYDAVALALMSTQQACEQDIQRQQQKQQKKKQQPHPNAAELHTYQLLIITDGQDNASKSATAASVHSTLLHPGKWAGLSHFSSCFVAIGAEAARALAPCTDGLKHAVTVADIDAGFRRLNETVAQIKTTTVQSVSKTSFAFGGGGAAKGA